MTKEITTITLDPGIKAKAKEILSMREDKREHSVSFVVNTFLKELIEKEDKSNV